MIVWSSSRLTVIRVQGTLSCDMMFQPGKAYGEATVENNSTSILAAEVKPGELPLSEAKNRFLARLKARGGYPMIVATPWRFVSRP